MGAVATRKGKSLLSGCRSRQGLSRSAPRRSGGEDGAQNDRRHSLTGRGRSGEQAGGAQLDAAARRLAERDGGVAERRVRREERPTGPHEIGVVRAERDDLVDAELREPVPPVAARARPARSRRAPRSRRRPPRRSRRRRSAWVSSGVMVRASHQASGRSIRGGPVLRQNCRMTMRPASSSAPAVSPLRVSDVVMPSCTAVWHVWRRRSAWPLAKSEWTNRIGPRSRCRAACSGLRVMWLDTIAWSQPVIWRASCSISA